MPIKRTKKEHSNSDDKAISTWLDEMLKNGEVKPIHKDQEDRFNLIPIEPPDDFKLFIGAAAGAENDIWLPGMTVSEMMQEFIEMLKDGTLVMYWQRSPKDE